MTIEEKMIEMLGDNGMYDAQAKQVMERVKADKANDAMAQRWGEPSENYPIALLQGLWLNVNHHALEWIDANLPLAWYRPMFVEEKT